MPSKNLKILIIGDIVGRPGRDALSQWLPNYQRKNKPDAIIANVENLAHGASITSSTLTEMEKLGIIGFTSGNHIWRKSEGVEMLKTKTNIIRPANYPKTNPGKGYTILNVGIYQILLINVIGRVFMPNPTDDPFTAVDTILTSLKDQSFAAILVDIHAEATSEKVCLGWYLDGQITAVYGTHTHVPTADARLLHKNTAYITDIGMTGNNDSSIGRDKESTIKSFLTQIPSGYILSDVGESVINAIEITADSATHKAIDINHIHQII